MPNWQIVQTTNITTMGDSKGYVRSIVENSLNQIINKTTRAELLPEHFRQGTIKFHLISNVLFSKKPNSDKEKLMIIQAKEIISHQIPTLGSVYIAKTLFDPCNRTLLIMNNNNVLACMTFRPFWKQGFSEIIFFVVSAPEQVKGYGSLLMNILKDYHISHNILYLLTYADNNAIGFFKKQQFSEHITLPPSTYIDYIKHFNSSKLMQCRLNSRIRYCLISKIVALQKEWLLNLIVADTVHQVETKKDDNNNNDDNDSNNSSLVNMEYTCKKCKFPDDHLLSYIDVIFERLKSHSNSWPFLKPIIAEQVPDYHKTVKYAIDLETIGNRHKSGYYTKWLRFNCDIRQIFINCRAYYPADSKQFICANTLEQYYSKLCRFYLDFSNEQCK